LKKKWLTVGGFILIINVIFFALFFYRRQNCIKPAVNMLYALVKRDNEQYFIVGDLVRFQDGWCFLDGYKWESVYLTGKTPKNELSWTISGEESGNKFLVKGRREKELEEIAGKEVIYVEDWSIIAPVHRTYQDEDINKRFFYPLFYLDRYDRENDYYYDIVTDIYAITPVEKEWMERNSEMSCFLITSDVIGREVKWYMKEGKDYIPITICGNTPEDNFNDEILKRHRNSFLVEGELLENGKTLEIYNWYICSSIDRGETGSSCAGFFTKEDIRKGIYIPDGIKSLQE